MRRGRILGGLALALSGLLLLWGDAARMPGAGADTGRMKNVEITEAPVISPPPVLHLPHVRPTLARDAGEPESTTSPRVETPCPTPFVEEPPDSTPLPDGSLIRETTIAGGLSLRNETSYNPDLAAILADGPALRLSAEGPQLLIIHTHASEAYTPAGLDRYVASDANRTEDDRFNVIRVGDELCAIYEQAGLRVIHDRGVYDYPSYTGSYARTAAVIEQYLTDYPTLRAVIDLHRDALGGDGVVYKIMAEESGVVASQLMLLCGTDASGLEHPNWLDNFSFALYLQDAVYQRYPTLMRPVALVPQRYNQHLTAGSLILEVGSSGNTLQEALAAIRLFGEATAPSLLALVETDR